MSMRDEQDDSVDALIDDTARSLTNGQLRAGFATRVRARIAHPRVESWRARMVARDSMKRALADAQVPQ